MYFLLIAASIVSLVCWIMVLIKMFQSEGALKGIFGIICGIYAFIWGWMNASRFNIKNIMIAWTIAIILSIVANMMYGGFAAMQGGLPQ
jgi:hypothetical protein